MPLIELNTLIHAPIDRCFDLSRSIDLHKLSVKGTQEEAVAGTISGLISYGEEVTWRAKHFGVVQLLTSKITAMNHPSYFRDEMLKGAFRKLEHDHNFEETEDDTLMRDKFVFESPFGPVGKLANVLVLTSYLRKVLIGRNAIIKEYAETDLWKTVLQKNI